MFAVVNHLYLTKSVDELGEAMKNDGLSILSSQPGFRDFHLVKAGDHHAIAIMLWDTAADARNGAAKFGPTWFDQHVAPFLEREQGHSVGEVIVTSAS